MPAGATPTTSSDHTNVSRIEIGSPSSHTHGSSANRSPIETPIKRRGRPPGSTRSSSSASADEASTSEPKRRGRPLGSKDLTSRKAGTLNSSGHISMPTRPRGSNTTPARPSGLRNAITPSDGIAVVIVTPSRSTNSERKRKDSSREPSRSLKVAPQKKSSPAYKIYKCEWKGCKAELHNLETLRKHVRKLHRTKPNADGIPCLWSKCEKTRRIYDKQTRSKKEVHYPHTFSTPTLWDAHMDKAHLEPTAWALGDGPSARPSGKSPRSPSPPNLHPSSPLPPSLPPSLPNQPINQPHNLHIHLLIHQPPPQSNPPTLPGHHRRRSIRLPKRHLRPARHAPGPHDRRPGPPPPVLRSGPHARLPRRARQPDGARAGGGGIGRLRGEGCGGGAGD